MSLTHRPALLGGPKAFPDALPSYRSTGSRETDAVLQVMNTGVLSDFVGGPGPSFDGGARVRDLDQSWAAYFDVGHAVSVNSATSGLHAALVASGAGPGDEVIVPPLTMSATATAIVMAGGCPVFVDVEEDTGCLDPARVEAAIGPRTKAVIVVNLFGGPAKLSRLRRLADAHGLILIEDNAQGPGGRHEGRPLGTIGHLGVFSLNCHKTIQCGEGGVVVTSDPRLARRIRLVRNHGENLIEPESWSEDADVVGCNYRLTELQAAIASVQLDRLEELTEPRIAIADKLTSRLGRFSCLRTPQVAAGDRHVYYVYPIWFSAVTAGMPKDKFVRALAAEGAPVVGRYVRPLYHLPLMRRLQARGLAAVREPGGVCEVAERTWSDTLFYTTLIQVPGGSELVGAFEEATEKVLQHAEEIAAL